MTTETDLNELDVLTTAEAAVALSEDRDFAVTIEEARDVAFALDLPIVGRAGYMWTAEAVSQGHLLLDAEGEELDDDVDPDECDE
jgi:hypothetical protein